MKLLSAIGGGFAGAATLTLLHETIRRLTKKAPRMDQLGMEAIGKSLVAVKLPVPEEHTLFKITMAGDIISNSLYYSVAAIGDEKKIMLRGILLGLAAGLGAVYLPKPMGLSERLSNRTLETKLMTVGLYLTGGVVASLASKLIENSNKNKSEGL
ncbi:hypothetical protein [Segetibacter sp.]|jgi:hypothetical protein|uniref:hypothetical protein n=1 Tax=Segetibacter sp. TaxID=2231182 RepID=UPI00261FFFCD|nr:hypothetical protein [Segetibacter sp.]MCW3082576.1 hypothetical protein [Segetibacter sp.]